MEYYEEDIEKAKKIAKGERKIIDDLAILYRNTNEDLIRIFEEIEFKEKRVLSVLSSSDQLFSALALGAKEVDTFDANRLTEYYYYLRKWCLEETKKYYISANDNLLTKIVEKHSDENEFVAKFWLELIKTAEPSLYYSDLFFRTPYYWSIPYHQKEEELIELLKEKKHNFECIDIFEEQNINKKYDIILISNIIEYLILLNNKELEQSFVINMYNLLEDDGIIISTKVLNSNYQESEMDNYFDKKAGNNGIILCSRETAPISYQYTKKKLTII